MTMNPNHPIDGSMQVGTFSVDSGSVAIIDPCYLIGFTDDEYMAGVMPTCEAPYYNDLKGGMVFSTMYGDGQYPIVAEFRKGRIVSLTISFDEDEDDDLWDEDDEDEGCGKWGCHYCYPGEDDEDDEDDEEVIDEDQ